MLQCCIGLIGTCVSVVLGRRSSSREVLRLHNRRERHVRQKPECHAVITGAADGLGMQSRAMDQEGKAHMRVSTNCNATTAIAWRRVLRKTGHLEVRCLWLPEVTRSGRVKVKRILEGATSGRPVDEGQSVARNRCGDPRKSGQRWREKTGGEACQEEMHGGKKSKQSGWCCAVCGGQHEWRNHSFCWSCKVVLKKMPEFTEHTPFFS